MISSEDTRGFPSFQVRVWQRDQTMKDESLYNDYGEELFVAGQIVPAGTYLEVDSNRQVTLDYVGPLPASFNGRKAYYSRLERPWMKTGSISV